jgi:hypothetical protein
VGNLSRRRIGKYAASESNARSTLRADRTLDLAQFVDRLLQFANDLRLFLDRFNQLANKSEIIDRSESESVGLNDFWNDSLNLFGKLICVIFWSIFCAVVPRVPGV